MRVKSTGLGKTELFQVFSKVYAKQDYLVIEMRTTEPVKWHVRTAATYTDLLTIIKLVLKPAVIWWLIKGFIVGLFTGFKRAKNPRPIEEY